MKTARDIILISLLQRLPSLNSQGNQGGVDGGALLNLDANGFTMIKMNISSTLKHVLALPYISCVFEDRKIFFFAKRGRQLTLDLIGIAWIKL